MTRFDAWRAAGGEVSVVGLGRSGIAAVRLLAAHGIPVYASDAGSVSPETMTALRGLPDVTVEQGGHAIDRITRSAALVVSPGVPPDVPVLATARAAGVPIVAEAQLGLDALPQTRVIAVTGTNGKTTTTALVGTLLQAADRHALTAGNIGRAVSEVALLESPPEWLALELSSFQLHDMPDLSPTVGILTNLAPDHLDRYPDAASYYADKARLLVQANARSIWVGNLDDPRSRAMLQDVPGRHLRFTVAPRRRADAWLDHAAGMLMLGQEALLPRNEFPLLGDHNVANALAAALAVHAAGVSRERIAAGLRAMVALPHRLEPVREVDGVLWINDSKATNLASTEVAVLGMDRPFVLLLGGRHKGEPYSALAEPLRTRGAAVVTFGEAADLVVADLADAVPVERVATFEAAVERAAALVPHGGAVLLSPACSSYDMFPNYEVRGETFRALVQAR